MQTSADARASASVARLREIANPQLYRCNAFRITSLPVDASDRAVREHRQRVVHALEVGATAPTDGPHSWDVSPDPNTVEAAFEVLRDSQRRIVDEILWFWDTADAACGCAGSLHADHDAAVEAHASALDHEIAIREGAAEDDAASKLDTLWADAARLWSALLSRAAFWEHVRHRVHSLDDRQLGATTVDELRDHLPRTLVAPMIDLADGGERSVRLIAHADRWRVGQYVVEDLLADATAALHDAVAAAATEARRLLDAGYPARAATDLERGTIPTLTKLDELVPHHRNRRTAVSRDKIAVLVNNCAMALLDPPRSAAEERIRQLFDMADDLAVDPDLRETIEQNMAQLDYLDTAIYGSPIYGPSIYRPSRPSGPGRRAVGVAIALEIPFAFLSYGIYMGVGPVGGVITFVAGTLIVLVIVAIIFASSPEGR